MMAEFGSLAAKASGWPSSFNTFGNSSKPAPPLNCTNWVETPPGIYTPIASWNVTIAVAYLMPIVAILGVIGNTFSFIILKESALRVPSHFYLIFLSVCDSLSLLSYLPSFWAVLVLRPYYNYMDPTYVDWVFVHLMQPGICEARMFTTFFFRSLSVWTIVLFTIERFTSVVFPMSQFSRRFSTIKGVVISLVVLGIICFFANLPWLLSFKAIKPHPCSTRMLCVANTLLTVNKMVNFSFLSVIPAIIICVCNIVIVVILKRRTSMPGLHDTKTARQQERLITARLLTISTSFFLLTIPSLITVCISTINELQEPPDFSHRKGTLADLFHISMLLFMVNLAINFVLYCLTGPMFRRAAGALFCCRLDKMRSFRRALVDGGVTDDGQQTETEMVRRGSSGISDTRQILSLKNRKPSSRSIDDLPAPISPKRDDSDREPFV